MQSAEDLKQRVCAAIDAQRGHIVGLAQLLLDRPAPGFQETQASRLVQQEMDRLGIPHQAGLALTGVKGYLDGACPGPTVAVIGELDSLRVPDHPRADPQTGAAHACGHHGQIGMMLGAAAGLQMSGVMEALSGRVALLAVPAEELIDVEYRLQLREGGAIEFLSGKQELIRIGAFDDVDMALMVHTSSNDNGSVFTLGGTSNGHVVKYVRFLGRAGHDGAGRRAGANALNAATFAVHAIHSQREAFKEQDVIRIHGVLTRGGTTPDIVPDDVRLEGRVRGRTAEAVDQTNGTVDRALRAGALAVGGTVEITTMAGYLPMINNALLQDIFRVNAARLVGEQHVLIRRDGQPRGGSTDMGDLSHLMPAVHPYVAGATGTGHGNDYLIQDYVTAVIQPAKALAMSVVELMSDNGLKALDILSRSTPRLTKERYLDMQRSRVHYETYGA